MSRNKMFLSCAVAPLLALAAGAPAAVTVIDPNFGTASANTISTGNVAGDRTELFSGSITPGTAQSLTYSVPGSSATNHANATFFFGSDAFTITNIDNARTGGTAAQQHVRIAFTVDVLTNFIFSGEYTNTNIAASSGRGFMQNSLSDNTDFSTPIPTTSVTGPFNAGANPLSIVTKTGVLTPGHTYVWDIFIGSLASGNPAGSTGTGSVSLAFAAVPEPASLGMLAMAGFGLLLRRRK